MLVGEQPGDKEDVAGQPFVGPAGQLLDRALIEAGIDRQTVYITNVVKHFKWTPRGKRRLQCGDDLHARNRGGRLRGCHRRHRHDIPTCSRSLVRTLSESKNSSAIARAALAWRG